MKKSEALEKLRTAMRLENKSLDTQNQYVHWVSRYLDFVEKKHRDGTSEEKFSAFIENLVNRNPQPSLSNQKQGYWAIKYFYTSVFGLDMKNVRCPSGKRVQRLFSILTRDQIRSLIGSLPDEYKLIAKTLYGTGMRIGECLSLRVKDINFENELIYIQEGKGDKPREVDLPPMLVEAYRKQLDYAKHIHEYDRNNNANGVYISHLYTKKNPSAAKSWEWFWVFPNPNTGKDPLDGVERRHHVYDFSVQKAFREARKSAKLPIYTIPHILRHCHATHYLEEVLRGLPNIPNIEDFAYDLLRKKFGHIDRETTKRYVHLAMPKNTIVNYTPLSDL